MVLLEEELVVIDLQMAGWPTVPAPYLAPLHSSAITFSCHISNVPPKFWERVISAGQQQCPLQNYEVGEIRIPCKDPKLVFFCFFSFFIHVLCWFEIKFGGIVLKCWSWDNSYWLYLFKKIILISFRFFQNTI